jgi:hypothetical protein
VRDEDVNAAPVRLAVVVVVTGAELTEKFAEYLHVV